jgi:C1A family cysteine protease
MSNLYFSHNENRVKFSNNVDEYENIIAFLEKCNMIYLSTLTLDFEKIPLELHGNGISKNLNEFLSNNNDTELIFKFIKYFINFLDIKYESGANLIYTLHKRSKWQDMIFEVYDPDAQKNQYYGWKPDSPDPRDYIYKLPKIATLPSTVDLRPYCPPIYDQGNLGSCTAQAIAAALEYEQIKKKGKHFVPSRLFIYYNERVMLGTVNYDSGAMIRDGMKSVNNQGACNETIWPYVIPKFTTKPISLAYNEALKYRTKIYSKVDQNLTALKKCLSAGDPFVFGFLVFQSFITSNVKKTGVLPMPGSRESIIGGHAVLCVGYDDKNRKFIIRNSWGKNWGINGYFTMPYDYLTNSYLTRDIWVIKDLMI